MPHSCSACNKVSAMFWASNFSSLTNPINSSQTSFPLLRYRTHLLSCSVAEQSCVSSAITLQYFDIDARTRFLMKMSAKLIYGVLNPRKRVLSITGSMIQIVFELSWDHIWISSQQRRRNFHSHLFYRDPYFLLMDCPSVPIGNNYINNRKSAV